MSFAGAQAFVPNGRPERGVAKWRLLRLTESREGLAWERNTSPERVSAWEQDSAGWITLDLENPSTAADTPNEFAYLTWDARDIYGRVTDPGAGGGVGTGIVQVFLERDTAVWAGDTAQATVGLGLCDNDGDAAATNAQMVAIGIRTPAAASTYTAIAGNATSASAETGLAGNRLVGYIVTTPTQIVSGAAGALNSSESAVGGAFAANAPPLANAGERVIWLGVGCNSTADNGPHTVRFRAFYRILPAPSMP